MKKMTITKNNGTNPAYQGIFDTLIQEVFGFSFQPWFEYKLWDDNYESYSIIENGKMLSNVCIYKSELLVQGKKVPAMQFGAVATLPEARGRGLSRLLMNHILSLYPDRLAYLAANKSVKDFYPLFGFKQIQTYSAKINAEINNDPAAAIKYEEDDNIVQQALQTRGAFSGILDCINTAPIQMFHMIMSYSDAIYHLPKSDVIALAQQQGDTLYIADIISQKPISFSDLATELPFTGVKTVEFGFCPDWLGITPTWAEAEGEFIFVKGNWNLPTHFRFPQTSET